MYNIEFTRQATKDLKHIPKAYIELILGKIKVLAVNPYSKELDIKKLKGIDKAYRFRVGEYRVIYEVEKEKLKIIIIKIQTRGQVYG